jgi:hypothetical protein
MRIPTDRIVVVCTVYFLSIFLSGVVASQNCYALDPVLESHRLAYFPFHGDGSDKSGNGNNLTVYGASLTTDRLSSPADAYEFDGIDDYLEKWSPSPVLSAGAQNWSMSAWIKADEQNDFGNTTTASWIVGRYECGWGCLTNGNGSVDSASGYKLLIGNVASGGNAKYWTRSDHNDSGPYATSPQRVDDSQWHHVVGVLDRATNTSRIYVDGLLAAELDATTVGSMDDEGSPLEVGRVFIQLYDSPSGYFKGKIDDISIFNVALTNAEVILVRDEVYSEVTPTPTSTPTVLPTSTSTPTSTATVGSLIKLQLTSMPCTSPNTFRWRVRNLNSVAINANWNLYNTGISGSIVANPGYTYFETSTSGNTLRLYVGAVLQATKASQGCNL